MIEPTLFQSNIPGQVLYPVDLCVGDVGQHVGQVGLRVQPVKLRRAEQTVEVGRALAAFVVAGESSQPRGISPLGCSRNRP